MAAEANRSRSVVAATQLKALGAVLGLLQQHPAGYLQAGTGLGEPAILAAIEERRLAKQNKDFGLADRIRKDLLASGVVLKDSPQGTTWERI